MNDIFSQSYVWLVNAHPKTSQLAPNHCVFVVATMNAANSIISNLTFAALTPIYNRPVDSTFQNTQNAWTELNRNLASVFTPLGSRLHGHLDLVTTSTKYTSTTSTSSFVFPINPATVLLHIYMTTTAKIANTIRLHGENCRALQLYHVVGKTPCNQLIAATPRILPQELQYPILLPRQVTFL